MSLTPIRVRGKKTSVQTQDSKYSVNSVLNPYPRGKRTLPPAHPYLSPARLPRHPNTHSDYVARQAMVAAPLERLPTELLEAIFLHTLNLSLPQASPILGSKLASDHVKTQLVLKVYGEGEMKPFPPEQTALFPAMTDQAEVQSAILRMKWMTLTFIRQLIPNYIVKTLVRELSERGLQWLGRGPLVTKETESAIRQYLENTIHLTKRIQGDSPVFGCISWLIENPLRLLRLSFSFHVGMVAIEERRIHVLEGAAQFIMSSSCERHQWRIFCGVNGFRIPDKLLHGPWTHEKCDFLEMLVRGNATIDWVGTLSGEIAEKGLMQALREGNSRATRLLVAKAGPGNPQGLWGSLYSSHSGDIQTLEPGPWPRAQSFEASALDVRGVGVVPQTRHLRTAVIEAGFQQDIIKVLLMAEDTSIDAEDQALLEWAVEKSTQGDDRGSWLLSILSLQGVK